MPASLACDCVRLDVAAGADADHLPCVVRRLGAADLDCDLKVCPAHFAFPSPRSLRVDSPGKRTVSHTAAMGTFLMTLFVLGVQWGAISASNTWCYCLPDAGASCDHLSPPTGSCAVGADCDDPCSGFSPGGVVRAAFLGTSRRIAWSLTQPVCFVQMCPFIFIWRLKSFNFQAASPWHILSKTSRKVARASVRAWWWAIRLSR